MKMKKIEIPPQVIAGPMIDRVFCLIKGWPFEERLTISALKIPNVPEEVLKIAVYELKRVHMISVDPSTGEISANQGSPYESYAWYLALNMYILDRSLGSFIRKDPDMARLIKDELLSLSAECIIKKKLVVIFLMLFKGENGPDIENKISDIKSFIQEREIQWKIPEFFSEWLEEEMMTLVYFSRIAIFNYPSGVVWGDDISSFFAQIGCKEEDIKDRLNYLCSVNILRFENGIYKVQEDRFSNVWNIYMIPLVAEC